jgi:hypothetical protein
MEDARRANLVGRQNWKAHPAAMLRARCAAALARAVYPDLLLGVYEESEGEEIVAGAAPRAVEVRTEIVTTPDTFQRPGKQAGRAMARAAEEPPPPPPAEDVEFEEVEAAPQVDILSLIAQRRQEIAGAPDRATLRSTVVASLANDPEEVKAAVRPDYEARLKQLAFSDLLAAAKKPGADLAALKAHLDKLPGTAAPEVEKELAAVFGGGAK